MTDKLPPNLLALFAARPPLRYLPHPDHAPEARQSAAISGVAAFLPALKEQEQQPYEHTESWFERRVRIKAEKKEALEKHLTKDFEAFNPSEDPQIRGDAFKTLFVGRLSYEAKESDLEREFGRFGPIERIRIVADNTNTGDDAKKTGKKRKSHRGYAFIVFEREKDMKAAYKETDGIRIKDRRVLVDVERGRTVKGWRPRRFGGGLGGRGYTKTGAPRPGGPGGPGGFGGGGFRGGFRGGFERGGYGGGRGFRGDRGGGGGYGGRGGVGYQGGGGFGRGAPPNAPSGPGGRPGGGPPNGDGGYGGDRRNGSYDDRPFRGGRDRERGGFSSGSNREPVRPRDSGRYQDRDRPRDGGDRDRDRPRDGGDRPRDGGDRPRDGGDRDRDRDRDRDGDRGYGRRDDDFSRKRHHDGGGYDDPRKRRY